MNVARLKRLEQILRRVDARPSKHRQFDMSSWFSVDIGEAPNPKFKVSATGVCEVSPVKHACGTSACALGHAALDPKFQKDGLRMRFFGDQGVPKYKGEEGFTAGAKFFDITEGQANYLFSGSSDAACHVADRVKDVYTGRANY